MNQSKTIAVLPFANRSSDQELEYFSDGISEEIINALTKIKELQVTSRTSSFAFKGTKKTLKEIAQELNVSTILEGSVRLSGTFSRITVQLVDVATDTTFWSETFDRDLKNVFAIQDEISLLIADKLREHIGHFNMDNHLVDSYDISFEVYKKYLKARFHLMKLDYANTTKAISIFEEVIADAPDFPLSYLDINQGYTYMATMGMTSPMDAYIKAQPFLQKAIELKPELPETQLNLAWIAFWQKWDFKQAHIHLNNALSVRPTDNMYLTMANFYTVEGKLDIADKYLTKALELAPLSPTNVNYKGFLAYMREDYENALKYYKQSLQLQADLPFPVKDIGVCYLLQGQHQKGLDYFKNLPDTKTGFLNKLGGTTLAHIMMGNPKAAEAGILELKTYLTTQFAGNAIIFLVFCQVHLNNIEKALEYIKLGLQEHFSMVLLLPTDPLVKPLHKHPKFKQMMGQVIQSPSIEPAPKKSKKLLFTEEQLHLFKERLVILMEEEQLYLNPELSLRSLAEYMNLPANQMSQLLNKGFMQNFSNYINSYRLEYFKKRILDESVHHLTILALAYDSGFNSKTVFNTFFKKKMGMTPKTYWKKVRQ